MDAAAERAIRESFIAPPPHNVVTIPDRARQILNDWINGPERIDRAIDEMVRKGKLEAPQEPWKEWRLL